jgi:glycosyltransferase involved in cell wall biosynthesis
MDGSVRPRLSVVVPCHNRAGHLDVHLRSLTWSEVPSSEFEAIVVDDGGTDDVTGVVDRWRSHGLQVRVIRIERGPGLRNNAVARNVGLRESRYDVVVQTDPDIVFASDVLVRARDTIDRGLFLSCSGYYPLTRESTQALIGGPGEPSNRASDYLHHAAGRPNQVLSPDGVGGLHGAFVCWRDDLLAVGGYNESFRYWGWEDRELLVTLADRGLTRDTMPDSDVVHLWHPPARGELGRDVLAAQGVVSRPAWEVQFQRASAEYPRRRHPIRNARGEERTARAFDPHVFTEWSASADSDGSVPIAWQLFFDTHRLEALELRARGHDRLARALLVEALQRPWEAGARASQHEDEEQETRGLCDALRRYRNLGQTLEILADCEWRLGQYVASATTLRLLETLPNGEAAAAAIRAQLALRRGDGDAARAEESRLRGAGWTPLGASLAIELALLDDRPEQAWTVIRQVLSQGSSGELFEQMRFVAYSRLLMRLGIPSAHDSTWTGLMSSPAAADGTEFVFSAAMRSRRVQLDIAALLLFDQFLTHPGRTDDRLLAEATTERCAVLEKLERLCTSTHETVRRADRPAAAVAQKPYKRSNLSSILVQS